VRVVRHPVLCQARPPSALTAAVDGSLKGRTQYTESASPLPTVTETLTDTSRVGGSGGHVDAVTQVKILGPEGNQVLVSAGRDGVVKMWR
jgi:hypothetical protein